MFRANSETYSPQEVTIADVEVVDEVVKRLCCSFSTQVINRSILSLGYDFLIKLCNNTSKPNYSKNS